MAHDRFTPSSAESADRSNGRPRLTAVLVLLSGAWLIVQLPAFLCMGLDGDPTMYDLIARRVLAGDVHYRDLLETNFPGIVWVHMVLRSLFGWSSVALRVADLAVVGSIVGLLTNWLPRSVPARGRIGVVAVLLLFYFSTSEWCHCQRDVWMLLPCLVGVAMRCRQADRMVRGGAAARLLPWAFLEGAVWAIAFWIKPFAALPGLACWLISVRHATTAPGGVRRSAADLAGFVAGGLVVGGVGTGWLVATGAWTAFVDVMFDWNREYFACNMCGESPRRAALAFAMRFFPWLLIHLIAVPLAVTSLITWRRSGVAASLRAGFYLAWLLQSVLLQHLFDYVHVPAIFLGIVILAVEAWERGSERNRWFILLFLVACVGWRGIGLTVERATVWSECLADGSTPAVRDRVTPLHRVRWVELSHVAEFLRTQGVCDGELTCFSAGTISLYNSLDVRPSTRYLLLEMHLDIFASRKNVLLEALSDSRQRYLVCDAGIDRKRLTTILGPDPGSSRGYWLKDRLVYRSGEIVVLRLTGPETAKCLDLFH